MTPAGDFSRDFSRQPVTRPTLGGILARLVGFTIVLGFAALAFWLAVFTVPILIVVGLVAYAYVRFRMARHGIRFRHVTIRTWRR
ncbi:MAG: hypothetical protein PHT60_07930 [Acidiphilium sp.]|nr:hypothetical protein [Acidiphilium sp.]MDD4935691.1 hypothetical protein [Acidiphilium sp.]